MVIGQNMANRGEKMVDEIKKAFDEAERIGVVGSPSSTGGFTVDILGTAVSKRLVGNLIIFNYTQDGKDHYALGQITEITMQNVWTQDPTMRGLIRQKGRVDPITERQDVHTAKMTISSVFAKTERGVEQSILGTVPSTGTPIKLLNENIMNALLKDYKEELFYLGRAYGTNVKLPMWLKHFGFGNFGAGEAYHIGVFGKTGSGKSVLAKMMMLGYARHREMAIFVLDPQGDYTKDLIEKKNVMEQYKKLGRDVKLYHISNIVLDDPNLFVRILAKSNFWEGLVRTYEYRVRAGEILLEFIKKKKTKLKDFIKEEKEIRVFDLHKEEIFKEIIWDILNDESFQNRVYSKQYAKEFKNVIESGTPEEYYERWLPVAKLFTWEGRSEKALTINKLIREEVFTKDTRPVVIIDLSKESIPEGVLWNDEIQTLTIKRILDKLSEVAEEHYKNGELLNSLVIIDEAHRFAPREKVEDEALNEVKSSLIDAVRTTRKYGLGWMFISQTLSSLDREIINQIRIYVFGFGLAWGVERQALREIIGGAEEAIRLYQMFRDPQSSLGKREYPFMTIGPISPLSFSGTPLFFTALEYPDEFLKVNFGVENES